MAETIVKAFLEEGQTAQSIDAVGKLDSIIVKTDNHIEIIIESEHGYLIMKKVIQPGSEYIAPRTRAVTQLADNNRSMDIPDMEKFNLNEKIIIILIGPRETNVDLIFRFT